jgi:hypothetical protein
MHEAMHRIFREHPEGVGATFRTLGFDFPDTVATSVLHTDLTEIAPIERRADTVLRIDTKDGKSVVVVIEAQRRPDLRKLQSWPYYIAYLHEYHSLPVILMVLCQDRSTSMWAQEPICVGTDFWASMTVRPLVLGPHNVPYPSGRVDMEDIPLAALAAVIHGQEPGIDGILDALATALKGTDDATYADVSTLVLLGLARLPAEKIWRKKMAFTLEKLRKSPELRELLDEGDALAEAKGHAKGRAADILRILDKRGVSLTGVERGRISGCTDLVLLDRWFEVVLDVETAEQLFG